MLLRIAAGLCMALVASGTLRAAPVAEPVDMLFRQWSSRDGLPNNRVREVIRTRDGFIWLATDPHPRGNQVPRGGAGLT